MAREEAERWLAPNLGYTPSAPEPASVAPVKLQLRFPASAENAIDHAQLAVEAAWEDGRVDLDYSPASLELVDTPDRGHARRGLTGEDVAEALFVLGCYVGEVMARALGGRWIPTARSPLADVSPWPMVVVLPGGSAWDAIGKAYKRLELGDSEYLPAFFARRRRRRSERPAVVRTPWSDGEPSSFRSPESWTCTPLRPATSSPWSRSTCCACRERGTPRGPRRPRAWKGVQRAEVRRLLARLEFVLDFGDAPPVSGGWGATTVRLAPHEEN